MDDAASFVSQTVCRRLQLAPTTPLLHDWVSIVQCVVRLYYHHDQRRFLVEASERLQWLSLREAIIAVDALLPLVERGATELADFQACANESLEELATSSEWSTDKMESVERVLLHFNNEG